MQVVGQSINQRATGSYAELSAGLLSSGFTRTRTSIRRGSRAPRCAKPKLHGVDWIKIYTTQDFVGDEVHMFTPDATLVNSPSLTLEEVEAIVDEAHRLGLKVACHTYGGEGMRAASRRASIPPIICSSSG